MLASSPAEPRWLVLVTEDTCTLARDAAFVKAESKSLTASLSFVGFSPTMLKTCHKPNRDHQTEDAA